MDARNPSAHAGLAEVFIALKDGEAAVASARAAVDLRKRRARYRVLLGDALAAAGQRSDAQRAYLEALDLEPDNAEAKSRLGR